MDISKILLNNRESNYIQNNSHYLAADVILIDKSQGNVPPILYQLKKEEFDQIDQFYTKSGDYFFQNPFTRIGIINSIEETKKMITLDDGSTVSYNYLIVIFEYSDNEINYLQEEIFKTSLHTLIDAICLRKKIVPSSLFTIYYSILNQRLDCTIELEPNNLNLSEIKQLAERSIPKQLNSNLSNSPIEKLLFIVQI